MADHPAASAAATQAFARVAALAADHHTALDPAVRLMHAHAWVGGGAPAFAADLTRRRAALHAAFTAALHSLSALAVRHGAPAPALPAFPTPAPALGPAPGSFQGIDPRAMTALITALTRAGDTLTTAGTRLTTELTTHGLPTHPGHTLGHLATWATTEADALRRRLTLIQQQVPGAELPASLAAHGLFSGHAGAGTLLSRVVSGDSAALTELLATQESGRDPALAGRVNAWWHSLSHDLRERLLGVARFGLLNGLPAIARDQANRRWLSAEKERLTREMTATAGNPLLLGGWEKAANQLRRLEFVEKELRPHPGYPPPLLLGFDLAAQGRLIVSWGDPDIADVTVTSVSGFTTNLDTAHGDLRQSRALWLQATKTSGGRRIATITWYGYDAPQPDLSVFNPSRSVASDQPARRGGAALAAFQDGLHAAHLPSGTARVVIVGHSYGSLTTGHAARLRPGRLADELILVGSPGVGVDHAAHLGMDPRRVWVGEAGGDPVAALGRFGADPGNDSFGARRLPVGRTVWTEAHSSYWDRDSPSLRNLGRVINGQYDKLISPPDLTGTPQLLAPQIAPDLALRLQQVTPR
ncbi:alpha/beta hydrolase [Nonomuraea sp. NPDC050310]|uniref:alpha/beta hydrolase n=1 Tax=Nonomuraea sp. NPDC050310 TaxID=3154935 RepID=UPI0033DAF9C3